MLALKCENCECNTCGNLDCINGTKVDGTCNYCGGSKTLMKLMSSGLPCAAFNPRVNQDGQA